MKVWKEGMKCRFGRQHQWVKALKGSAALDSDHDLELPDDPLFAFVYWCHVCDAVDLTPFSDQRAHDVFWMTAAERNEMKP